jgi:hypothetical protein
MTEDGMGIAFRAQGIILPFSPLKKKKKEEEEKIRFAWVFC